MSQDTLSAHDKIKLGTSSTPPQRYPGQGPIFLRNGPGALHNTSGMKMAEIDELVKQWNLMPAAAKVGMSLID